MHPRIFISSEFQRLFVIAFVKRICLFHQLKSQMSSVFNCQSVSIRYHHPILGQFAVLSDCKICKKGLQLKTHRL